MYWIKKILVILFTIGISCSHTLAFLNNPPRLNTDGQPTVNNITFTIKPDCGLKVGSKLKTIVKRTHPNIQNQN